MKNVIISFILSMVLVGSAFSAEYIPLINGQFYTGQYYFEGEKSGLGGNVGINFIPAIKFSEKNSLISNVESQYRGTRSAEELAGGNTLFQDSWDNAINIKAIQNNQKGFKLKERMGVRQKWYRETSDENWNKGLYDYRTFTGGLEGEYSWGKKKKLALAYDFSFLKFPNYQSLEASQDNLAREFSAENPLDNYIHVFSLGTELPLFFGFGLKMNIVYSPRFYTDQTIVNKSGLLTASKRNDVYSGLTSGIDKRWGFGHWGIFTSRLNMGYTNFSSNQNNYDARVARFNDDYYSYDVKSVGAQFSLGIKGPQAGPIILETGYSYSHKNYLNRHIQTVAGNYNENEKLFITDSMVNLGFSYPIAKHFRAKIQSNFGQTRSNNDYEAVYQYNYNNSNYQFGFTYEY
ncbi:MAG: hypothetical protein ACKVQC_08245 [Elusimicrobiota bacterium]